MTMIFIALVFSLIIAIHSLPVNISLLDAVRLAGAANRINIIDTHFNLSNRYNLWSGLIGGGFLALAYFGCDQSQVQRYLTGRSIAQSRLSLIFNAIVKIPMQLFILFIGVVVFAVSLFVQPPMIFHPVEELRAQQTAAWAPAQQAYEKAFGDRREAALTLAGALRESREPQPALAAFRDSQNKFEQTRHTALGIVADLNHAKTFDDTNYIFMHFIRTSLPVGLVGLVIGVILSASMGSTSGEINSLATVALIDIYRRYVARNASDHHYLTASRWLTVFWAAFAVTFAAVGARGFGALIERVNIVGSLFYPGLLGAFVLAFFFKHVRGTAAFYAVILGEAAIFICAAFTDVSFLWYNVVGSLVVVSSALIITALRPRLDLPA
jgi:Na+/proline symporter